MITDLVMLSAPPKDVIFHSLEEMYAWYMEHPERMCVLKNVDMPEPEAEAE